VPAEAAGPLTLTRQGRGLLRGVEVATRTDVRGGDYHWLEFRRGKLADGPDCEAGALAAGCVSATPLRFERTDEAAFARLAAALNSETV
jgi:5'-nucleotidase